MSDETPTNDDLLDELIGANWSEDRLMASDDGSEAAGQKIVNAALRVREARAAVAARMSSPSHDRATSAAYDAECSAMLAELDTGLKALQGLVGGAVAIAVERAQTLVHAITDRLASNELAHDRAMAEGVWQCVESAPKDGTEVLLRAHYPDMHGVSNVYHGWWARDHWTRWPHQFWPTHFMIVQPLPDRATPTTKENSLLPIVRCEICQMAMGSELGANDEHGMIAHTVCYGCSTHD